MDVTLTGIVYVPGEVLEPPPLPPGCRPCRRRNWCNWRYHTTRNAASTTSKKNLRRRRTAKGSRSKPHASDSTPRTLKRAPGFAAPGLQCRVFEASRRCVARGDLNHDVALHTGAKRLSGGTEKAKRVRGQRAAGKGEGAARAARRNNQRVVCLLPARDRLAGRASDRDGEVESGSGKSDGRWRGDGRGSDRERSRGGATGAGLKDDRGGAVGARGEAAGASILRDGEWRGSDERNWTYGVIGRICDGHRLGGAGLTRANHRKCDLRGVGCNPVASCPEPFSGTEAGATPVWTRRLQAWPRSRP